MTKILEFWIITKGGIPVFSYSPDSKLNPSLMSSFFSALQSYLLEISEKDAIDSFSIGNFNYNFLRNNRYGLYFIAKSDIKTKPKNIEKYLKNIAGIFLNAYKEDLEMFDGDIAKFEEFQAEFDNYLKKKYLFF